MKAFYKFEPNGYMGTATIQKLHFLIPAAELAQELVARWGLVAGEPDGEDSAGRAKIKLLGEKPLVCRACLTAELLYEEFDKRGWLVEVPQYEKDAA